MPPAALEILIDTEAMRLVYRRDDRVVHHEIRQFVHGATLRDMLERGLEAMVKYQAHKWLSDDRGNGPLKPADEEWSKTHWFPRAIASGWKHWAVVMPNAVLGQMNMRRWIELYQQAGINAHPFDDPQLALKWLREQS